MRKLSLTLGATTILTDVDLQIDPAETVTITGRSGSGKSSLLSCILGLIRPSSGSVSVTGEQIGPRNSARIRRTRIGMVYQSGELLPELTAAENVVIAGLLAGQTPREAGERAEELLSGLGVPHNVPSLTELSGGERQRVAVARALMNRPALILADEPTGSMDETTRDQVVEALFALPEQFGCALLVVTHDPVVAARASRQVRLDGGRLHASTDACHPPTPMTAG